MVVAVDLVMTDFLAVPETSIQALMDMSDQEFKRLCHQFERDEAFGRLVERISKVIY